MIFLKKRKKKRSIQKGKLYKQECFIFTNVLCSSKVKKYYVNYNALGQETC